MLNIGGSNFEIIEKQIFSVEEEQLAKSHLFNLAICTLISAFFRKKKNSKIKKPSAIFAWARHVVAHTFAKILLVPTYLLIRKTKMHKRILF